MDCTGDIKNVSILVQEVSQWCALLDSNCSDDNDRMVWSLVTKSMDTDNKLENLHITWDQKLCVL